MQPVIAFLLTTLVLMAALPARAQSAAAPAGVASQPAAEQVIVPQVTRREVKRPRVNRARGETRSFSQKQARALLDDLTLAVGSAS